jgi:hypothetical protein
VRVFFRAARKKEQGANPAQNVVSTLFPRQKLDLIFVDGVTLLVRARAPPETWTTRLQPIGQPEPALVDYLFRLVTIFGNDCSKFEHFSK